MKLSVGYNFDFELLRSLLQFKGSSEMTELYGSLPNDVIGSSRESYRLTDIDYNLLQRHIEKAAEHNITFNYVLNTFALTPEAFVKNERKIFDHLDMLEQSGVTHVTVAVPMLIDIILKYYPKLKVVISTIYHADNVRTASYWDRRGVDRIIVSLMKNRDFQFLNNLKQLACDIEVMLNECCVWQCAYRDHHYICQSLTTNKPDNIENVNYDFQNYPYFYCTNQLNSVPEMLMSRFIRPEDQSVYEEAIKPKTMYGKITGRTASSEFIARATKAYVEQQYDGNLVDLFPLVVNAPDKSEGKSNIFIDNNKLNSFLQHFVVNGHKCANNCGKTCFYCYDYAKKIGGE